MKMRRINVTITAALVLFFYLSLTTVAAQPIVEELTIEPGEPTTLSTITFTAVITSEDDIGEVRLIIEECKVGLCYLSSNESMDMIEDNTYQTQFTLTHADATYVKYHLEVESGGEWFSYDIVETNLTADTDNGLSNGENGGNGTPGFEIVIFLLAISIGVFIFKRKRL